MAPTAARVSVCAGLCGRQAVVPMNRCLRCWMKAPNVAAEVEPDPEVLAAMRADRVDLGKWDRGPSGE